ncbi:unnamed protein product [Boreogadus saida]
MIWGGGGRDQQGKGGVQVLRQGVARCPCHFHLQTKTNGGRGGMSGGFSGASLEPSPPAALIDTPADLCPRAGVKSASRWGLAALV